MKRYVLKVNGSDYVKSVNWITIVLPVIKTGHFEDAFIFEESYLSETVGNNGYAQTLTRKDLILSQYLEARS